MAIDFGYSTNNVSFGDVSALAGITGFSCFFILTPDALDPGLDRTFASQYSLTAADQAWRVSVADNDEIAYYTTNGGGSWPTDYHAVKTTDANLVIGTEYRILVTFAFSASASEAKIWVNGSEPSITFVDGSSNANISSMINSSADVRVCSDYETGQDGKFSEFAIWDRVLSSRERDGLMANRSPRCYPIGGLLYLPMLDTSDTDEEWAGITATVTGGANATHPVLEPCTGVRVGDHRPRRYAPGRVRFGLGI